ncbi:hypothetical protein H2203_000434 [Taxawa tesnikishii (nom. ined.)]|nr:hypothetical protein H2203_000434 [Dothideales sp. JES 119]
MDVYHNLFYTVARIDLHSCRLVPEVPDRPRILDVGTGTGFWAIDMAEIPPNVRFSIPTDFESLWTFGEDSWDLIHLQMLCGSVTSWPNLYQKVFQHLRPGYGYIEQLEVDLEPRCDDGTLDPRAPLAVWYQHLAEATARAHKPIAYQHNTRQLLEQAGFIDIKEQVIRAPYNRWPKDPMQKDIGAWYRLGLAESSGLEALSLAPFSRVFNWPVPEIRRFAQEVRHQIGQSSCHAYNNM